MTKGDHVVGMSGKLAPSVLLSTTSSCNIPLKPKSFIVKSRLHTNLHDVGWKFANGKEAPAFEMHTQNTQSFKVRLKIINRNKIGSTVLHVVTK